MKSFVPVAGVAHQAAPAASEEIQVRRCSMSTARRMKAGQLERWRPLMSFFPSISAVNTSLDSNSQNALRYVIHRGSNDLAEATAKDSQSLHHPITLNSG